MKIEVSNGEIIDKMTILQIKYEKIKDEEKRKYIKKELNYLLDVCKNIEVKEDLIKELYDVNLKLWNIEDNIREKENNKYFNQEFIDLSRSVYFTNDLRGEIKNKINIETNSKFKEVKEYTKY